MGRRRTSHDSPSESLESHRAISFVKFVVSQFDTLLTILTGIVTLVLSQFNIIPSTTFQSVILVLLVLIAIHLLRRNSKDTTAIIQELKRAIIERDECVLQFTPTGEYNYRLAVDLMLSARKVWATYFLRPSWEEKPANLQHNAEFTKYFDTLHQRISSGDLQYRWIVTIEDQDKFNALLKRIKNLLQTPAAIKQGYTRLRVVSVKTFSPRICIQINDDSSVLIGFPTDEEGIGAGALIRHGELVNDFQRFFEQIWSNALPIVDIEVKWDNLRRVAQNVGDDSGLEKLKKQCQPA